MAHLSSPVPLPARTAVSRLAAHAVGAVSRAAGELVGQSPSPIDPVSVAVAYSSERWFRRNGNGATAFAPLSGFFRTRDGWVRTHGNYPHHAEALRRALALENDSSSALAAALLARDSTEASRAVTAAGGLCVVVAHESSRLDAALRTGPVIAEQRLGPGPVTPLPGGTQDAPLRGIRVLDLTRVIAGPVATRSLALLGADVLRIDPPRLPEIAWQHLDTGHGKRSALLDLATTEGRSRFDDLVSTADVVALGYRPASLARFGLSPAALAARRPGVIVLQHTAWGDADRRGFDSLVQAASGIAWIESADGETPGALPAQALDHTAGYLLAAAALTLLARRAQEGGSWSATTSLRRIAAELLGMPRSEAPMPAASISAPTSSLQTFDVAGDRIVTAAPAIRYRGGPTAYPPPRPWGGDAPTWLPR